MRACLSTPPCRRTGNLLDTGGAHHGPTRRNRVSGLLPRATRAKNSRVGWLLVLIWIILAALLLTDGAMAGEKKAKPERFDLPRNDRGKYEFAGVVEVPEIAAAELYSRAKAWVAIAYRSAQHVMQLDDKDAGRLVLKGAMDTPYLLGDTITIRYAVTVEVKDARYRYALTDFIYSTEYEAPLETIKGVPARTKRLQSVDRQSRELIAGLEAAMKAPAAEW